MTRKVAEIFSPLDCFTKHLSVEESRDMSSQHIATGRFQAATVSVAAFFILWNVGLSTLQGWPLYYHVCLNLAVIFSLLLGFKHARFLVRVWAAIPLASLGLFLLSSLLKGKWSAQPMEHAMSLALTLPILIWSKSAFGRPSATGPTSDATGSSE